MAHAIDSAGWPEVNGTVAGDDTLFLATASEEARDALFERFQQYLKRSGPPGE